MIGSLVNYFMGENRNCYQLNVLPWYRHRQRHFGCDYHANGKMCFVITNQYFVRHLLTQRGKKKNKETLPHILSRNERKQKSFKVIILGKRARTDKNGPSSVPSMYRISPILISNNRMNGTIHWTPCIF